MSEISREVRETEDSSEERWSKTRPRALSTGTDANKLTTSKETKISSLDIVVIAVLRDYALPAVIFPLIVYDMFTLMLARIVLHDVIISLFVNFPVSRFLLIVFTE